MFVWAVLKIFPEAASGLRDPLRRAFTWAACESRKSSADSFLTALSEGSPLDEFKSAAQVALNKSRGGGRRSGAPRGQAENDLAYCVAAAAASGRAQGRPRTDLIGRSDDCQKAVQAAIEAVGKGLRWDQDRVSQEMQKLVNSGIFSRSAYEFWKAWNK